MWLEGKPQVQPGFFFLLSNFRTFDFKVLEIFEKYVQLENVAVYQSVNF
jgi:hypothetical protein